MNHRASGLVRATDSGALSSAWPRAWLGTVAGLVCLAAALAIWVNGTAEIDLTQMSDHGLISVLPPSIFVAIAAVVASAVIQLQLEPLDEPVLAIHVVALVFVLYAVAPWVEDVPRTSTVWTHLGFIEYIARTGNTAPEMDARMSWPGFFVAAAFIASVAGMGVINFAAHWSSVIFNLLYLIPFVVIARVLTGDRRLVWAAALLFALTNWIGQDYFSPQALAFFMYLVITAVVVSFFLVQRPRSDTVLTKLRRTRIGGALLAGFYRLLTPDNPAVPALSRRQQVACVVVLITLFAYLASSHQLMPFATTASLITLLMLNRTSLRAIPVLFGVITVTWVSYMTVPFLSGHVGGLIEQVGSVGETIDANVSGRIGGSPGHEQVVTFRVVFTLALWTLAGFGAIARFQDGKRDLTTAILAATPFPLIALQAYGGEILLRAYLFSLPFVVILAAGLVYGRQAAAPSLRTTLLVAAGACVVATGFLLARYGNERLDHMTASEVAAVEVLYEMAPPGSLLVSATGNLPWKFERWEQYAYTQAETIDVTDLATVMRAADQEHAFLILTKSQGAHAELLIGLERGYWDRFLDQINASDDFTVVYRNADAEILVLREQASAVAP